MGKSIKLKNNYYISSQSIIHNLNIRNDGKDRVEMQYLFPTHKINMNKPSSGSEWIKILSFKPITSNSTFQIESYSTASQLDSRGHFKVLVSFGTNNNVLSIIYATNLLGTHSFDYRKLEDGSFEVWFEIPQWTGYDTLITPKYGALPTITLSGEVGIPTGEKLKIC